MLDNFFTQDLKKNRDLFPLLCKELGYTVGAEIGVGQGKFTEKFAKLGLQIFGIDPWMPYVERSNVKSNEFIYKQACARLAQYPNVKIIREESMKAVGRFMSECLDFVYIDGCHDFRHVAEDIYEWAKIVRQGGIVAGHDYDANPTSEIHCSVVVDAYVKLYGKKLLLFGKGNRDRTTSWMFTK